MPWYAHVTKDSDWPSRGQLLHLQNLKTFGREPLAVFETPEAIRAFLTEHPEIGLVMFYGAWMPRRAVPVAKVTDALLGKLFRADQRHGS
jgi:hypothetical protein